MTVLCNLRTSIDDSLDEGTRQQAANNLEQLRRHLPGDISDAYFPFGGRTIAPTTDSDEKQIIKMMIESWKLDILSKTSAGTLCFGKDVPSVRVGTTSFENVFPHQIKSSEVPKEFSLIIQLFCLF